MPQEFKGLAGVAARCDQSKQGAAKCGFFLSLFGQLWDTMGLHGQSRECCPKNDKNCVKSNCWGESFVADLFPFQVFNFSVLGFLPLPLFKEIF